MPGSLLLGTDAYSDVSDVSGRSLDSKTGGKKVSFNKAVRVKQYPWKPDAEVAASEHLTLPSNRFWFKVYKNKHDSPISNEYTTETSKQNAWEEENMECIHDSLAPIAEVEDQDIEGSPIHSNSIPLDRNYYPHKVKGENGNKHFSNYDDYNYHPTDPPVDYFDEMHLTSNRGFSSAKQVWGANQSNSDRYSNSDVQSNISNHWNGNGMGYTYETIKENDENIPHSFNSKLMSNNARLPRTNIRNDLPTRRSMRRLDNSDALISRERRSRSHDDHMDNDSRFKHLRKADKSVSTEDLNFDNDHGSPTNRFFKGSRDIATQCYGTLTRNKTTFSNLYSPSSLQTDSYISNTERLKNFKSPRPKLNFPDAHSNNSAINQKKDYSLEKFSNLSRPRVDLARTNNLSTQTAQNLRPYNHEPQINGKLNNSNLKPLARTENSISGIIHKQANKTYNRLNSKSESSSILSKDAKKNRENTSQSNNGRESNTVGYLRGRQIPLSEVNTNTSRKLLSKNNVSQNSLRTDENTSRFQSRAVKSDAELSKGHQSKRYLSPTNNHERRSFRNGSNSAKSYESSFSEGDSSMIDWSLSGFQLAPKPEHGLTSMSDSEYTVHRRQPLLMYIPGVSHHDRPAVEDDRLSALSDISRSEINGGSLFSDHSTKDRNGDFRRRQSMREGKSKWMKWRSNKNHLRVLE